MPTALKRSCNVILSARPSRLDPVVEPGAARDAGVGPPQRVLGLEPSHVEPVAFPDPACLLPAAVGRQLGQRRRRQRLVDQRGLGFRRLSRREPRRVIAGAAAREERDRCGREDR